MGKLFDFITNPLGLDINPIIEFIIMFIIGVVAYKLSYYIVGDLDIGIPAINFVFHCTIRLFIYVFLWMVLRVFTDGCNLIINLFRRVFVNSV